ncbi:aminopeptidase Ey-like [Daktulosphaira vitifoliae]|uniref:aminopeptidase Ey-like n=1 Tax=Daktulosphaira vitifoliae TaxID=58002 RepID=UPI0021A9B0EC|nr:aminopeptidase Ey-like [Daktulosphaira vitifoliae]
MSTLQARHRGHNIPDGVTTFNEIEYDREGGIFLNKAKLILLGVIMLLLIALSVVLGRYSVERQIRPYLNDGSSMNINGDDSFTLFSAIEPENYKVLIDPQLYITNGTVSKHDAEYNGEVEVIFRPRIDTSVIKLHIGPLKIDNTKTLLKRREHINTETEKVLNDRYEFKINVDVNDDQEKLTVTVEEPLRMGLYYSLFVYYTGKIGRDPDCSGFIKVVFDEENVRNQWFVTTKLASNKAKYLMPCIDNPRHKAFFEMSVVRHNNTNVIFNTQLKSSIIYKGDSFLDNFEKTGLIRPDSLWLFISNFKNNTIFSDEKVHINAWSPISLTTIDTLEKYVPKTIDVMEKYLKIKFPTNKLEIVLLPSKVTSLTDNSGIITIKDLTLIEKQNVSSVDYQNLVEDLIQHVIHQWLIPLRSLDKISKQDIWLHEAIADFLKIMSINNIHPNWSFGARYSFDTLQKVMFYDSFTNTESLARNDESSKLYKFISPVKGATILCMLNNTLTEEVFSKSLEEYLQVDMYRRNELNSFWTILEENARSTSIALPENAAILQVVRSWTTNKNYPLISLSTDGNDLIVKQFRFEYGDLKPTNDWIIPIVINSDDKNKKNVWLENNPEIKLSEYFLNANKTYVLAHQNNKGYFRIIYDDSLLGKIVEEISKGGIIDEFTIGQVLIDHFEGALAGAISFNTALNLLNTVIEKAELNNGCWKAVYNVLSKLEMILHNTIHHDNLSVFMESTVKKAYRYFHNITTEIKPDGIIGKIDTLHFANHVELNNYVRWAKNEFEIWKNKETDKNPIALDHREFVYCTTMQYASKSDRRFLMNKYKTTENFLERMTIVKSFPCSQNSLFLNKIISLDEIREEDYDALWQSFIKNPVLSPQIFHYLRNNWESLYKEYSDSNNNLLIIMLRVAMCGLNSITDLDNVNHFIEKYFGVNVENRDLQLLDVIRFELEILEQKIAWQEKYETVFLNWLAPKLEKIKSYIDNSDHDTEEDKKKPKTEPSKLNKNISQSDSNNNI